MSSSLPTNNEVLVVGGTGSIGSAIVHALLDHNTQTYAEWDLPASGQG